MYNHLPKFFIFFIGQSQMTINKSPKIRSANGTKKFALQGVIYHGGFHFTSRLIASNGFVWFHDGQLREKCENEGVLADFECEDLSTHGDRIACLAIYVQQ
jgi:hypothetical protein